MNYIFYAIIANLFFAIAVICDKILRSKYVRDSTTLALFFGILNFVPFLFIFPFIGVSVPEFKILMLSILAGTLMVISFIPYFKSLSLEEASRVAPLWHISPIFVLILAFIFLGEKLTINSYIGFFFLLIGGLLICTRKIKDLFKMSKIFWLMITAGLIFSIVEILTKFIYNTLDFWNGIFWILSGQVVGSFALLLLNKNRTNFINAVKNLNKSSSLFIIGGLFGGFLGRALYFLSIMLGSVSLVAVISGFEGLFVLIYAIFLSKYLPKLFKEEIDKKIIIHKIIAIFLMFIGLICIYI